VWSPLSIGVTIFMDMVPSLGFDSTYFGLNNFSSFFNRELMLNFQLLPLQNFMVEFL
jgi:hypothetical protein